MTAASLLDFESMLEGELRDGEVDNPFRPAVLRWAASTGRPVDHEPVLAHLERVSAGTRGTARLPWRLPVGRWIEPDRLAAWRPAERELARRHPNEHAARLWLPPVLVEHVAWLEELAAGPDEGLARRARVLADEARPAVEDIVAQTVAGADTWADTFLLWSLARSPRALTSVRGLALALAARYAARAGRTGGIVLGRAFPYFETPMSSATAHLGTASSVLGEGMRWLERQLPYLKAERRADGGWGDPQQGSDILTTLAVARLLGSIDPSFDPASAVEPLSRLAAAAGSRPSLIGPEWRWVAVELAAYAAWAARDFTERFQWPNFAPAAIDARVNVPRFEGYLALADLFLAVPPIRDEEEVDVAFIDLANFGHWNTDYGMQRGDELLVLLTTHLRRVPRSRTFRDGGDEFLLVSTLRTSGLEDDLGVMFAAWPDIQRLALPGLPVVPLRAVISRERASALRAARERQGVWIGNLKHTFPEPPPQGVIRRYQATTPSRWRVRRQDGTWVDDLPDGKWPDEPMDEGRLVTRASSGRTPRGSRGR